MEYKLDQIFERLDLLCSVVTYIHTFNWILLLNTFSKGLWTATVSYQQRGVEATKDHILIPPFDHSLGSLSRWSLPSS